MNREQQIREWQKAAELREAKVNPWAVCTSKVGQENKEKYERCVLDVKKSSGGYKE
jgi:hypothetical protein